MKKRYIIACSKGWYLKNSKILNNKKFHIIKNKSQLTIKKLGKINPSIIFFPHWSYIVKKNILENFNCICFHTGDLPYGRGGSPIQNLIKLGKKKTKVCALKMNEEIDAGDIFLKHNLNLNGSLNQIFFKISKIIDKQITILLSKKIKSKTQNGKIKIFKRLTKKDIEIKKTDSLKKIYDKIRMVDNEDYQKAFFKFGKFKISFQNIKLRRHILIGISKIELIHPIK